MITLTIPNDDSTALYHFGKSLLGMAAAIEGAPQWVIITEEEYDKLKQAATVTTGGIIRVLEPEVDTTTQQVESLGEAVLTINGVEIDSEPASDEEITGRDKSGTPWDERIHSTSKALNADGTWRLRRKPKDMDEAEWAAFVEVVKAELMWKKCDPEVLEQMTDVGMDNSGEPPVTPPGDEESELQPPLYEIAPGHIGVMQDEPPVTPPLPVPPPVVVVPPVPEVTTWDFPRLMTFLTERHGKIDVATVNTLLAQDGMSSVQELNAHPDKIGPFVARVKVHLGE